MNILHVINNLGSGGAEKLLADILPLMKQRGNEVSVLILNDNGNVKKFEKLLKQGGVRIINLGANFYNPFHIFRINTILRRNNFDVVHAHLFPSQYWLAFAKCFVRKNIKFIKTEHSIHNERKNYKILQPLENFVYSKYDWVIGIAEEVTKNISQWVNVRKVTTIGNGVNLKQIRQEQRNVNLEDYKFLDLQKFNILMTARFDGIYKNQQLLIETMVKLPYNYVLYFAGEGPTKNEMEGFAKSRNLSDRIYFLGLREDVYTLMNLVDLNVLSSRKEGVSGVTLENLASGKPFLGSNVEGIKELVPNDDFLYEEGNSQDLQKKIIAIADNPTLREQMKIDAEEHIKEFDIEKMVEEYLKIYSS